LGGGERKHLDLSASQRKVLARLLEAEPEGFAGGMRTEKYVNLTGTSRATAYRELTQLTEFGLLQRTGQGRGTRYALLRP
jgi:Fic family protein